MPVDTLAMLPGVFLFGHCCLQSTPRVTLNLPGAKDQLHSIADLLLSYFLGDSFAEQLSDVGYDVDMLQAAVEQVLEALNTDGGADKMLAALKHRIQLQPAGSR